MTSMRRLPLRVVATIIHDVLLGLDHAHGVHAEAPGFASRIHCDLAPEHVVVGFDGLARILNFGIPRAQSSDESPSPGKLAYLAPEQLLGGAIDRTVDVYACGVLLWELLTGVRFFNHLRLLNPATHDEVPKPSSRAWRIPSKLDAVVLRAMRRDPAKRFQTAGEMAEALAEAIPLATRVAVKTALLGLREGKQKPESEPPPAHVSDPPPRNSMVRELTARVPRLLPWLMTLAQLYGSAWHARVRQWRLRA
jgi:serine/threonine-protein kinase